MRKPVTGRQMIAQRTNAITFSGMMPRRNKGNIGLSRQMHRLLRNFAGNVGVDTQRYCVLQIGLCGARAPRHPSHQPVKSADDLRHAIKTFVHARGQRRNAHRIFQFTVTADVLLATTSAHA